MILETSLYWKNMWDISNRNVSYDITDQSGIYMILTGKKETILRRWKLLDKIIYIGYSKNIRKGLRDSKLWDEWETHNVASLVVKVAPIYDEQDPEIPAKSLIYNHTTLCNPEIPDDEVETGDIIEVKNKLNRFPLSENSQWSVTSPKKEESFDSSSD